MKIRTYLTKLAIQVILALLILLLFLAMFTYLYASLSIKEFHTQKAYGNTVKENCRIANGTLALNNNLNLYFLDRKNYCGKLRHVVAVDKNGIVYDISTGSVAKKGEKLKDYLKKTKQFIYAIYDINTNRFSYVGKVNINFIQYIKMIIYYYFYIKEYRAQKEEKQPF